MKIVVLAFNYARAGKFVNGPGICLDNFFKILKQAGFTPSIFTYLKTDEAFSIQDKATCLQEIKKSDLVIHWSGLVQPIMDMVSFASQIEKRIWLGSNLIDTVEFEKETGYLKSVNFSKILTVNHHLKFLISKRHQIPLNKIKVLMVGPDLKLWQPSPERDNTILWKGNSKHFVKDVSFALELQNKLPKYKFKFIGHPNPYHYFDHIAEAKKSKIYITTSLSETMGATLIESWASGLPSVSHPKVYLHGINYQTGIITNKNFQDYIEAIQLLMEDSNLYLNLSEGAQNFVEQNFSGSKILENFLQILEEPDDG